MGFRVPVTKSQVTKSKGNKPISLNQAGWNSFPGSFLIHQLEHPHNTAFVDFFFHFLTISTQEITDNETQTEKISINCISKAKLDGKLVTLPAASCPLIGAPQQNFAAYFVLTFLSISPFSYPFNYFSFELCYVSEIPWSSMGRRVICTVETLVNRVYWIFFLFWCLSLKGSIVCWFPSASRANTFLLWHCKASIKSPSFFCTPKTLTNCFLCRQSSKTNAHPPQPPVANDINALFCLSISPHPHHQENAIKSMYAKAVWISPSLIQKPKQK